MVDVMRSHIHLDIREGLVQSPHGSVVGSRRVQRYNSAGGSVGTNAVQHCCTAGIPEIHRKVQLLASLHKADVVEAGLPLLLRECIAVCSTEISLSRQRKACQYV